jgi:uncharacterized protein YfdQ (DUF2303 family)
MTFQTSELETALGLDPETEAAAVARVTLRAARPTVLEEDTSYAFLTEDGVEVVHGREPLDAPLRKTGTVRLLDADSFAAYVLKHADDDATELYADPRTPSVTAVLNGHRAAPDSTGHGDHRALLVFQPTPSWQRWAAHDGKLLTQVQFAEHIEASLPNIVTPPGADMLELAETFQAHTKVQFVSSTHLGSGQRQLTYREEVEAGAGPRGDIVIPKEFELGLVPYEGAHRYKVTARLRYRINDGRLQLGYVLDRPEDVQRNAFDDVLTQVQAATERTALLGTPA